MKTICFKKRILLVLLPVFLFGILLTATACEPGGFPVITNQLNQDIHIYVITVQEDNLHEEVRDYGTVSAHETKRLASITFSKEEWVYRIQAKDPSGKVVFSHDYNMDDLEKNTVEDYNTAIGFESEIL